MTAGPRKISSILQQLMARRGYGQVESSNELADAVKKNLGDALASAVRVGDIRRGVLRIFVADSVTMHELNFHQRRLLRSLQEEFPGAGIKDVRFRIGAS
jgi:hypothetical protein